MDRFSFKIFEIFIKNTLKKGQEILIQAIDFILRFDENRLL